MSDFHSVARRWLAAEPDADMRDELEALLAGPDDELAERFDGRLQFGTAGLRAAVGAGPQRMNRLVVQQAAAGLVDYLLKTQPDAAERGVIIGNDARRKSDAFALDTARVCAARGVRAMIFPHVVPTPLLAWNIVGVGAAAGVVVTASHNPPADNGYKVFTADGAQIVSPVDSEISACIDLVDPCAVELSEPDDPLIEWLGDSYVRAYLDACPRCGCAPTSPVFRLRTRRCTASAATPWWPRSTAPGCRRPSSWPSSSSPTRPSRRFRSRTPRSRGRWTCCWPRRRRVMQRSRCATIPTPIASAPRSPRPMAAGVGCRATRSAGCWPTTSCGTRPATIAWSSPPWCRRRCWPRWQRRTGCSSPRPTRVSSGSGTRC